jgi:hypothetical protein
MSLKRSRAPLSTVTGVAAIATTAFGALYFLRYVLSVKDLTPQDLEGSAGLLELSAACLDALKGTVLTAAGFCLGTVSVASRACYSKPQDELSSVKVDKGPYQRLEG